MDSNQIKCPECGTAIDVNEILYHQLKDEIKKEYKTKYADQSKELEKGWEEIKKQKESVDEQIEKGVTEKISSERKKIEQNIRTQITIEKEDELNSLKEQVAEKSKELKEFTKLKVELEKKNREIDSMKEEYELKSQQTITETLKVEKEKIRKDVEAKNEMQLNDRDHMINQLKEQLKDAQRKIEQGSMQSQGEVQELAIEDFLKTNFPLDTIDEIKKGARGADCIQIVNTREKQNCGSIYYESKRTKDFQSSWIEKFKADMRAKGATFGILVTEAYPKGCDRMQQIDGIWICSFEEFKGLCYVIRESVILLSDVSAANENKGTKMEMLYSYLTGPEFKAQVESIVEGFTQMHEDLNSEKRSIEGIWKKREKQIQKVLLNTTQMYGSIKGIAGNALGTIKALELPVD